MEILKLTSEEYEKWDNFCHESDDAWFWHTSKWLLYSIEHRKDFDAVSKSFFIMNDNKIVAICPLIMEQNGDAKEFSYGGYFGPVPAFANFLSTKTKGKVMKMIFENIDILAKNNSVIRTRIGFSPLSKSFTESPNQKYNYLTKFNYIDNSYDTLLIDLSKKIEELKIGLRHGHKYDVNQSLKILQSEIFDKNNIDQNKFQKYVDMHQKASGRVTRPKATFNIMYTLLKEGGAILVGAKKDDKFVGFSYFYIYKNNSFYGSSCNDPDYKEFPISHFIQWKAIEEMKKLKVKFYEIGWQYHRYSLSYMPSAKEILIGKFKRGFGGSAVPSFMGDKYYNKDFFIDCYRKKIESIAHYIDNK